MAILLFLALAVVYLVGIAGVVLVGSLVGSQPHEPGSLEERLALAHTVAPIRAGRDRGF